MSLDKMLNVGRKLLQSSRIRTFVAKKAYKTSALSLYLFIKNSVPYLIQR